MSEDVKKDERLGAQVIRLVGANNRVLEGLQKDLGPNRGDRPANAVQGNAFEPEDEYQQLYVGATRDQGIVQPPYNLRTLDRLSQENNALGPCIEAVVTNIVQTGYKFESHDSEAEDDADETNIQALKDFFAEPWPGQSWSEIRRLVRRDMERTGNGYLEILRNAQDKIVMFRHVDAKMMRLLRLDDAVPVDVTVNRQGIDQTVTVMKRERRYCQLVNGVSLMYFREFGATRDLNKKTAVWRPKGQRLPAAMRATEIMHFTVLPDAHTPYGIPRWVNQTPSVLGSRKAEEFNLEFFDNGGVPPVMVFLQGGTLQAETRRALEQRLSGEAKKNNRVQVFEVEPAGGSLNQPVPTARVTVERFGSERQSDSMFEKYDERCEERIRRAFRLPPIFVGQSKDYNFATAFASYTVAEAQVFKPERDAEDTMITMRLLPALGFQGYKIRSLPLSIEDATLKLQAIEVVEGMGDQVEPSDIVEAINQIAGLHLKISDAAPSLQDRIDQQAAAATAGAQGHTMDAQGNIVPINPAPVQPKGLPGLPSPNPNGGQPGKITPPKPPAVLGLGGGGPPQKPGQGAGKPAPRAAKKSDLPATGHELAVKLMGALRKRDFETLAALLPIVHSFDADGRAAFNEIVGDLHFLDTSYDPQGLAELSACTVAVMTGQPHDHAH
jgi:PBSX family phage portal protein